MKKTYIIAEAGVNHNGKISLAKKLIEIAKKCNADAVKFQLFNALDLVTQNAPKAKYQKKNEKNYSNQFDMLKKYQLNFNELKILKNYCNKLNIEFLCSVFDINSLELIKKLKINKIKIPSGEINNLPLLLKISELKIPIILSTGMSSLDDIRYALNILTKKNLKKKLITILHCNTEYPTPLKYANVASITQLKNFFNIKVGYSDHTLGIESSLAAVALGASIIEKHFTLNRNLNGPDHKASLNPKELKDFIIKIRNLEKSLGDGKKKITKNEKKNIKIVRKSIVAIKNIKKGHYFNIKNIGLKRPAGGLSPKSWFKVLSKKSKYNFKPDQKIKI